ncbi:MAG TPA: hypothetical protein PL060_05325, partial [bacterium]|nr:hypothetical protein [bacterium]
VDFAKKSVILLYCPVFQTILFYLIFHFPLMGSSIGTEWSLFLSILFLRKQYTFIEIFDDAIRGLDKNPARVFNICGNSGKRENAEITKRFCIICCKQGTFYLPDFVVYLSTTISDLHQR